MEKLYYEAYEGRDGVWRWKIYGYDATGNKEIVKYKSIRAYFSKETAEDAAGEFMEENGIEAEMA